MSVILTDADIPKNCSECPCLHNGEYGAFEKSWCSLDSKLYISEKKCPNGCKIKSVGGLIEKIEQFAYCSEDVYVEDVIEIIKEYCGMEDNLGRCTSRDEYGNADIKGVDMTFLLGLQYDEMAAIQAALNRLADFEDAEEAADMESEQE